MCQDIKLCKTKKTEQLKNPGKHFFFEWKLGKGSNFETSIQKPLVFWIKFQNSKNYIFSQAENLEFLEF